MVLKPDERLWETHAKHANAAGRGVRRVTPPGGDARNDDPIDQQGGGPDRAAFLASQASDPSQDAWGLPLTFSGRPEAAAEELLAYLPENTQHLIREAVTSQGGMVWKYLLGYVMRCADRGEIFAPYLLTAWDGGGKPNTARPCRTCGRPFVSRFPDAAYCCNPCACGRVEALGHTDDCPTRVAAEVVA